MSTAPLTSFHIVTRSQLRRPPITIPFAHSSHPPSTAYPFFRPEITMSRSRSASVEIIVPPSGVGRGLADVMEQMFKSNHREAEDRDLDDADAEADEIEDDAPTPQMGTSNVSRVSGKANNAHSQPPPQAAFGNAPQPCERCARTGKPCKGVPGSRCEHCKRLKQRCSNSSARVKHTSVPKKAADSGAAPKTTPTKHAGTSSMPQDPGSVKRKSPTKGSSPQNGDMDSLSIDGEGSIDEDAPEQQRLTKKRRISKGYAGPSRAQLTKAINDMEASVKRIQSSVAKEVEKINGIVRNLNAKIKEMDEE